MTVYASSTARTVFVGIPNQSVVAPRSRSKSSDDSGPSARIRSSTRSATSAFSARSCGGLRLSVAAEPRELARRDEGEPLVVRLEDLAALVELVAPAGLVVGDARVQHEVVGPAGNRERVELDRPELAEDLEHGVEASLERSRRREEVPGDEKTARGLGGDLHTEDANDPDVAAPGPLTLSRVSGRGTPSPACRSCSGPRSPSRSA